MGIEIIQKNVENTTKIGKQRTVPSEDNWWVREYAQDIHKHLRRKEQQRFLYRAQSPQLHMRKYLVEWLEAVCEKMEFCCTVQHLAVYLLDIFMDNHTIHTEHLQIVTLGCLILAVKLEEKDSIIPKNSEFNELVSNKYKLIEFVQMEVSILTFFKWEIMYPTAAHFVEYYSLFVILPTDNYDGGSLRNVDQLKVFAQKYIDYFLRITLKDVIFIKFNPSLVASACIAAARVCCLLTPSWPVFLRNLTEYKQVQLRPCIEILLRNDYAQGENCPMITS